MMKVKMIDLKSTGEKIATLMEETGTSKQDIVEAVGLTTTNAIYKWVNGMSLPTIDHLVILADVLGVTLDELLVCREVQ